MIIKVYDFETLEPICSVSKIKSFTRTFNFYSKGSFELHLPLSCEYLEDFKINNIICSDGKAGIIRYIQPGAEYVKICGYDLKFFLKARLVIPPFVYLEEPDPIHSYDRIKGTGEYVMKYYVNKHIVSPYDEERKISNVRVAENLGRGLSNMAWQAKFETVEDTLVSISEYTKLGYDITFEPAKKEFAFDVYEGVDKTRGQSVNSPVIFGLKNKTLSSSEYTNDCLDAINCVYVGGGGEEEEQYVQKMKSDNYDNDVLRVEQYTDCSSDDVDEIDDAGLAFLEENKNKETIEGVVNSKYKYKEDWDLGDYVTLRIDTLGQTLFLDKQIVSVTETYEHSSGTTVSAVFGTVKDNIIKRLLKGR